jgi:hypothetical protein
MMKHIFKALTLLAYIHASDAFSSLAMNTRTGTSTSMAAHDNDNNNNDNDNNQQQQQQQQPTRRQIIQQSTTAIPTILLSTLIPNQKANAAIDLSVLDKQASKFKRVPLFAIVDGKTGTPFMILQNTGKAQAYFFTTYEGAQSVLDDARKDAAEKGIETAKTWEDAKLSAVNLEFALKLGSGRPKAMAQNNVKYDTVYDVIPSLQSLGEAERIDKSGMYSERGRVPLFYSTEFEIGPEKEGGPNRIPIFLEKKDLIREFSKKYPEKEDLVVTVVDLMDTFAVMLGNKPIGAKVDESIVNNLYVVPSIESRKKAVECEKARGTMPAYKIGEMVAVGGK